MAALVGFDADDTLWHSEGHFAVTEERFGDLLSPWASPDSTAGRLLEREQANLALFGYGAKGFTLSMIETAIELTGGRVSGEAIGEIVSWGKELLAHPVELLDGVIETLDALSAGHQLVLITKGDLFHQESKVAESGLADLFDAVHIVSEKTSATYREVLDRFDVAAPEFVMVGNSLASDVLPAVEAGCRGIHVPYSITWAMERVEAEPQPSWVRAESITEVPLILERWT